MKYIYSITAKIPAIQEFHHSILYLIIVVNTIITNTQKSSQGLEILDYEFMLSSLPYDDYICCFICKILKILLIFLAAEIDQPVDLFYG
ncbi:MAG: hypothetical protein ACKO99_05220 [Dolichospermum sp.]